MKVNDVVIWKPKSIGLVGLWCAVKVTKLPVRGWFSGIVVDQRGFEDNLGHEYHDWDVGQIHES